MRINSIIFHTTKLNELRKFYEDKLGFQVGTYEKDGTQVSDSSETYVNYDLHGMLLCFEFEENRTDLGTIVLSISSIEEMNKKLQASGIATLNGNSHWLKIKDPEGRSLIMEQQA